MSEWGYERNGVRAYGDIGREERVRGEEYWEKEGGRKEN